MTTLASLSSSFYDVSLPVIIREYVIFGDFVIDEILTTHGLSLSEFEALKNTDTFKAMQEDISNEIAVKGIVQVKARSYLEIHLQTLHDMIEEKSYEASDRIKALELLAKIADALPKNNTPANTGMMVNFDFGSLTVPTPAIEVSSE